MAKIMNQEEQRKALKNINNSIKELEAANDFLRTDNPSGKYSISFTGEDGKKCTAEIHLERKDEIVLLVMGHKEKEKKRIAELAQNNDIALDEKDHIILDFSI